MPHELETSEPEERPLLARLRAGDDDAFEELVRGYGGRMLATAKRFFTNEADAADAVQDAFLSVHRYLEGFSGDSKLSTWLHRIVVNACLMKLSARRSRPESSIEELLPRFIGDGHHAAEPADWRSADESELERAESRALVRDAIAQLPEIHRSVLLLRDIEGLSTAETATLLGASESATKVRLHRARQALRTLLDPHFRTVAAHDAQVTP